MNTVMQWLNANNGALMVLITLVYVIATIFISSSNRKSAEASRMQIEESQKQQKQNVGLQLYAMRKDVINKISLKQYNEVFWDIPLLFSDEMYSEFQKVALKAGKKEELDRTIEQFETEYSVLNGQNALDRLRKFKSDLSVEDDMQRKLDIHISENLARKGIPTNSKLVTTIQEYAEQVAASKEMELQLSAESVQLLLKLQKFVKDSIQ